MRLRIAKIALRASAPLVAAAILDVAACSDLDVGKVAFEEAAAPDARHEAPVTAIEEPDATCPADFDFPFDPEKPFRLNLPRAPTSACTDEDLAHVAAALADAGAALSPAFADGLTERCRACAVSKTDAAFWAPLVDVVGADPPRTGAVPGVCYAWVHGSAECGYRHAALRVCTRMGCGDCADDAAVRDCAEKVTRTGGPCAYVDRLVRGGCPKMAEAEAVCGAEIVDHVRALCAAEGGDAGLDAAPEGGGDAG